jgi:platelet-activating factor acetylhydrolase IB subunit alpha
MDECDSFTKEGVFHTPGYVKRYSDARDRRNQIMDLENRNAALQEELSLSPAKRAASQTDWVPRAPAAHVLTGHRAPVTRVAFHPQYSVVASASEDATVKIWDWETGEFERTLKGHTKAIMDVEFDHKGHLLGKSSLCTMYGAETLMPFVYLQLHALQIFS